MNRRRLLQRGLFAGAGLTLQGTSGLLAQALHELNVASAGSIRAMLDGPLKQAAAQRLQLDLHTHAGGADGVARSLVDGSLAADLFVPITLGPMRTVMQAGLATVAYPIARTEMVIAYSPKSRFLAQFQAAAAGKRPWWEVLQQPGLVFARSNPGDDPSGRAVVFAVMLAAMKSGQPDLVQKILGTTLNPEQIQPGRDVRKGLDDGTIDATGSYRIATASGRLPFFALPTDVNLSDPRPRESHPDLSLTVGDKTFYPEPLVFYAAVLKGAKNPEGASAFLKFLQSAQATASFTANGFTAPDAARPITLTEAT